ncbi:MAG: extradiol ring-cleavage dioxygenase [Burkholderiaceae bacterium]|nr:extradiol ring-cleavage dioxygenase [Burkholderiaceae bacterium]
MANIVLGIGTSHTPLLTLTAEQWQHRAAADYANKELNMSDGRLLTYAQVLAELGPRAADVISPEILNAKERACSDALDRLGEELEKAAPDVVIIVGDDQRELFTAANQPAMAIFHGEEIITSDKFGHEESADWVKDMGRGYMMDEAHVVPGSPALALEIIRGLMDENFDIATCSRVDDPKKAAFGHAYGFIIKRLFRGRTIPVVPVLLNTYYGPNVPTAARCHDLGQALRRVVEASPSKLRVAMVASGGLSHFVVDELLDKVVTDALASGNHEALRAISRGALNSGSSEILNWIVVAGAVQTLPLRWQEYQPLYRTPAGTGVGAGFAVWG